MREANSTKWATSALTDIVDVDLSEMLRVELALERLMHGIDQGQVPLSGPILDEVYTEGEPGDADAGRRSALSDYQEMPTAQFLVRIGVDAVEIERRDAGPVALQRQLLIASELRLLRAELRLLRAGK